MKLSMSWINQVAQAPGRSELPGTVTCVYVRIKSINDP